MIRIMKAEWYKLSRLKKTYFAFGFLLLLQLVAVWPILEMNKQFGAPKMSAFDFSASMLQGFSGVLIPVIMVITILELINTDLRDGTMRMTLIRPYSRTQVLLGKWLAAITFLLTILLFLLLISLMTGFIFFNSESTGVAFSELIGMYLAASLPQAGLVSLMFLLAILINHGATTMGALFLFLIGSSIVDMLKPKIGQFLLPIYLDRLEPFSMESHDLLLWTSVSVGYLVLSLLLTDLIFRRKDLMQ